MSSTKRIICLSNSLKLTERCIAGIDIESGRWVRPICNRFPQDGRVPASIRIVEGREPELLDILEIPLNDTGNDFGFECENLTILDGEWKLWGKAKPSDLIKYCGSSSSILHNNLKYVNPSSLQSLNFNERRTLQLIETTNFSVTGSSVSGWRGTIRTKSGQSLNDAKITDPVFVEKLNQGHQPTGIYLVTVSLSMPFAPRPDWEGEHPCWKLIAGVIEL
ncbi:dual OB domain-containing protein [Chamaesiphon minutus]|uniref:Dual OB-containing domain-containing protein n=1 Tax=Chamaesiphon minutus (strain ATCC 27169 / PCC 6605) TaxID=1173020 RepID=K9UA27_CHAP6|nr:hypothetical protein [Chamaesiphon minutus]AFY91957.1 hypothetical protein Cha6605_0685 [Chamaesiphon minutus PCC 6605]